jgi:hypothetical protein
MHLGRLQLAEETQAYDAHGSYLPVDCPQGRSISALRQSGASLPLRPPQNPELLRICDCQRTVAVVEGVVSIGALAQAAPNALDEVVGGILVEAAGGGAGDALEVALQGVKVWGVEQLSTLRVCKGLGISCIR